MTLLTSLEYVSIPRGTYNIDHNSLLNIAEELINISFMLKKIKNLQIFYQEIMKTRSIDHYYNLRKNICTLFHILPQFTFTTSEMELDSYHQNVNA